MHPVTYLILCIIALLLSISYFFKENLWLINIFKKKHHQLNLLINSHIFTCLMYITFAYIYFFEGYLHKISYIYDDTKNTKEDIEKKRKLKYNLMIVYMILMIISFTILKKLIYQHETNNH